VVVRVTVVMRLTVLVRVAVVMGMAVHGAVRMHVRVIVVMLVLMRVVVLVFVRVRVIVHVPAFHPQFALAAAAGRTHVPSPYPSRGQAPSCSPIPALPSACFIHAPPNRSGCP
jgi:hypothetical protein